MDVVDRTSNFCGEINMINGDCISLRKTAHDHRQFIDRKGVTHLL